MVCIYQRLRTQKHIITEAIIHKAERALRLVEDEAFRCSAGERKCISRKKMGGWVYFDVLGLSTETLAAAVVIKVIQTQNNR